MQTSLLNALRMLANANRWRVIYEDPQIIIDRHEASKAARAPKNPKNERWWVDAL